MRENPLVIRSLMRVLGLSGLALEWHADLAPPTREFLSRTGPWKHRARLREQRGNLVVDLPTATEAVVPQRPMPWRATAHLG